MENIKTWNKPISSSFGAILESTSILEDESTEGTSAEANNVAQQHATLNTGDATQNADATVTNATKSDISDDLKADDEFKLKIKLNFQQGNPTIIYKDSLYELIKGDGGKCVVSKLEVGLNNKFKLYSAALGGKMYEMITSDKGIFAKPLASTGEGEEAAVATLSDDSSTGSEEIIEIYPLNSTTGEETGAIRVNGENIKGNLTESKGADEFQILKKILTDNKIKGRKIVRVFKVDVSTIDYACSKLHRSMKGAGTYEDVLNAALKRLTEGENSPGNWMMMLYAWDQNKFGSGSAEDPSSTPVILQDFFGVVSGTVGSVWLTGGWGVLGLGLYGMIGSGLKTNISFNKNTPIYRHNDDTGLDSNHRGLLMDICCEMEDAWTSEQKTTAGYLNTLTAGLPDDNFCWRLVDSVTGELLVSSGDSEFFEDPKNKSKEYLRTCKSFKQRYTIALGNILGDDEFEGA